MSLLAALVCQGIELRCLGQVVIDAFLAHDRWELKGLARFVGSGAVGISFAPWVMVKDVELSAIASHANRSNWAGEVAGAGAFPARRRAFAAQAMSVQKKALPRRLRASVR